MEAALESTQAQTLLEIRNLHTYFFLEEGIGKAVDGVTCDLRRGETLGMVGESGCGKTVTALSILRLIPDPPGKIVEGQIVFDGRDLLRLSPEQMRKVRGNDISMIFQEPMTSLNPVFTIGNQISEVLTLHRGMSKKEALRRSVEMLHMVGIPSPELRVREYPHQLSGGMRQRAMIAMALACDPKVLIADEPTTALDVTIQAQILDLMGRLKEDLGTAIILITHDLGVVAETAQRVVVMYAGKMVEKGTVEDIFLRPHHPYTKGLLNSLPRLDKTTGRRKDRGDRLQEIPGMVPSLFDLPPGCKFAPRCPFVMDICRQEEPALKHLESGHDSACWLDHSA